MDPSHSPRYTFYQQKLALTSPASGGRSAGIIRSRTEATVFSLVQAQAFLHLEFRQTVLVLLITANEMSPVHTSSGLSELTSHLQSRLESLAYATSHFGNICFRCKTESAVYIKPATAQMQTANNFMEVASTPLQANRAHDFYL
jgi:hypothetical protein